MEILIKTWRCSCGYAQDFEPTTENMHNVFNIDKNFRLNDVQENECPSCALKGIRGVMLPKETDNSKKSKIILYTSAAEVEARKQQLLAKPKRRNVIGREVRVETNEEKAERIEKIANREARSDAHKALLLARLGNEPKLSKEFPIYSEETDEEKVLRIEAEVAQIKIASKQEIDDIRANFEDV